MECNKFSLNVRNAKGLNAFKNKAYLSYYYNRKMVDAGATTAAVSSNGFIRA